MCLPSFQPLCFCVHVPQCSGLMGGRQAPDINAECRGTHAASPPTLSVVLVIVAKKLLASSAISRLSLGRGIPASARTSIFLVDAAQRCRDGRANALWHRRHGAHGVSAGETPLRAAVLPWRTMPGATCRAGSTEAESCLPARDARELQGTNGRPQRTPPRRAGWRRL